MLEEEGGDTCFGLSIHDGTVDRRRTAIFRQETPMQVECAETGHSPHHLRQHPEGDDDEEVGIDGAKCLHKVGTLQFLRL